MNGSYAYVADSQAGLLQVVNISNPENPTLTGTYDTPGYADGVAVSGSYAYVADSSSGLQIINISNPSAPTRAGYVDTDGSAYGVAVSGSYAYVADGSYGLQIIDISNPFTPTRTGYFNTDGSAYGVTVSGSYAYVADSSSGLQIINISNPSAPTRAGYVDTDGSAYGVAVSGSYAYVADDTKGLQIINISNPSAPTRTGYIDTDDDAYGVAVSGSYAYVADDKSGLQIINISTPSSPTLTATYRTSGNTKGVAISGNYAYVIDDSAGFQVIDISTPSNPTLTGSSSDSGGNEVSLSGNYAYVAAGSAGLQVIDISTPSSPTLKWTYNTLRNALGVAVNGNYAYVADYGEGLQIIDISNPETAGPTLEGTDDTSSLAYGVAVSGSYAYMANSYSGLGIIDISNPANPELVNTYDDLSIAALEVAVNGNYAHVADYEGLQIIDISNPVNPQLRGTYETLDYVEEVVVNGNYAYIAGNDLGLEMINVTDPTNPAVTASYIGAYYELTDAVALAVSGDYIYVCSNALYIFKVSVDTDDDGTDGDETGDNADTDDGNTSVASTQEDANESADADGDETKDNDDDDDDSGSEEKADGGSGGCGCYLIGKPSNSNLAFGLVFWFIPFLLVYLYLRRGAKRGSSYLNRVKHSITCFFFYSFSLFTGILFLLLVLVHQAYAIPVDAEDGEGAACTGTATVSASDTSIQVGESVRLTSSLSVSGGVASNQTYRWTYNDGSSDDTQFSTSSSATFTPSYSGTFEIELAISFSCNTYNYTAYDHLTITVNCESTSGASNNTIDFNKIIYPTIDYNNNKLNCSDYSNCNTGQTANTTPHSTYSTYNYNSETDHFVYFIDPASAPLISMDQLALVQNQFECAYHYFICDQGFDSPLTEKTQIYIGDNGSSSSSAYHYITVNYRNFTESDFTYILYTLPIHEFFHQVQGTYFRSSNEGIKEGGAALAEQLVSKENYDYSIGSDAHNRADCLNDPYFTGPYAKNVFLRYIYEQLGGASTKESFQKSTNRSVKYTKQMYKYLAAHDRDTDFISALEAFIPIAADCDSLVGTLEEAEQNYITAQYAFRYVDIADYPQYTFLTASDLAAETDLTFTSEDTLTPSSSLNFTNSDTTYLSNPDYYGSYDPYGFWYYLDAEYHRITLEDGVDTIAFTKNIGDDNLKFQVILRYSDNSVKVHPILESESDSITLSSICDLTEIIFVAHTTYPYPISDNTGRIYDVTLTGQQRQWSSPYWCAVYKKNKIEWK